jgi:hypothetical protein
MITEDRARREGADMVLTLLEKGEYTLSDGTKIKLDSPVCGCSNPITYLLINVDEKEKEKYEKLYEDPYLRELVKELETKMNEELKRRKSKEEEIKKEDPWTIRVDDLHEIF